jgi:transposase
MPKAHSPGKPASRRYSPQEEADAVLMVRTLRTELGTAHGTAQGVAAQRGYGARVGPAQDPSSRQRRRPRAPGVGTMEAARAKELEQEHGERNQANDPQERRPPLRGARPPTQEVTAVIDANRGEVVAGSRARS